MEHITSEGIIVTNRVFVGGIPSWMNEIKLQLEFEDLNLMVKDTRIVEDQITGRPKGYGFVTFFDSRVADGLIKEGYLTTNGGLHFRIGTAIRKKALELRYRKLQEYYSKQSTCTDSLKPVQFVPWNAVQSTQPQVSNYYPHGGYYIAARTYPEHGYAPVQYPPNISSVFLYNN